MRTGRRLWDALFVWCALCLGCGVSYGADWTLFYEDGVEMHYYDRSSVSSPRKGAVAVNRKTMFLGSQEGKIDRVELNCTNHTYRVLSPDVDKAKQEPLSVVGQKPGDWTWFPLESRMMALYENLCE